MTAAPAAAAAAEAAAAAHRAFKQAEENTGLTLARLMSASNGQDTPEGIPRLTRHTEQAQARVAAADHQAQHLAADPAVTGLPDPTRWLTAAHTQWNNDRHAARAAATQQAHAAAARAREADTAHQYTHPTPGLGHDRGGPDLGL